MWIDGVEFKLLRDYDKGKYHHLSFNGKVTYLRERVEFILLRPCRSAMLTAMHTDLGLVLATAICAGISAASTFYKGRKATGEDKAFFMEFVKEYMNPVLKEKIPDGRTWAEWLYADVRCGLAHDFTIESGGVEYQLPSLVVLTPYGPEISPALLLEDFGQGWSRYLAEVTRYGPGEGLGQLFVERFREVFTD